MVKKMSKKILDQKGRLRNKIISFRMSKEEAELLDRRVLMSGLTKQDFIVNSLLGKEIAVYGNPYVFRNLQDELIRFINLYGTKIDNDADDEMITLALKTILAMRKRVKQKYLLVKQILMKALFNKVFVRMFLRFRIMRYGTGYAIPHFLSRE